MQVYGTNASAWGICKRFVNTTQQVDLPSNTLMIFIQSEKFFNADTSGHLLFDIWSWNYVLHKWNVLLISIILNSLFCIIKAK